MLGLTLPNCGGMIGPMTVPVLRNADARRLFLHLHGLGEPPAGPAKGADLVALIKRIGFVQVDSINTVERAHHMILFARRPAYRPKALKHVLERDRLLFEHWTHDASVLPVSLFPYWQHRFVRDAERLRENWRKWFRDGYEARFGEILNRIARDGPVTSTDVGEGEARGKGGWWDWHPSKTALEWLWRTGQLQITRREGFQKVYDLTERVIPDAHRQPAPPHDTVVDWACASALDQLGFTTPGDLYAYWHAITPQEARLWCKKEIGAGRLIEIAVEGADGNHRHSFARPDVLGLAADAPELPARLRILSPFDPALRDRDRAERLFGFSYRIEVFVPEAKRRYGYYVFPLLEGARILGRIDMKARRDASTLVVRALWPEHGIRFGAGRMARLDAELDRMARFAGCDRVSFEAGWLRDPLD
jgi:uncharacterized protein YcaQ